MNVYHLYVYGKKLVLSFKNCITYRSVVEGDVAALFSPDPDLPLFQA